MSKKMLLIVALLSTLNVKPNPALMGVVGTYLVAIPAVLGLFFKESKRNMEPQNKKMDPEGETTKFEQLEARVKQLEAANNAKPD